MIVSNDSLGRAVENIVPLLGFRPVASLVVMPLRNGAVSCVLRADLADVAQQIWRIAGLAARNGADGSVAVMVSEDGLQYPVRGELRTLARALAAGLAKCGSRLVAAVVVDRIEAGGRWRRVDGGAGAGVLADPTTSVVATARVAEGRRVYGSRGELAASLAADRNRVRSVSALLGDPAALVDSPEAAVKAAVDAARRAAAGCVLSDEELARLGSALVDVRVRDSLVVVADSEDAVAAEALWTLLARVLPQPFRAEALALLAFSAYLQGDGPLASVALETALAELPGHRMAGLLDTTLQLGVRPEELRKGVVANLSALSVAAG